MLGLTLEQLALVLSCATYVFEQTAYHSLSPKKLLEALQGAGLNDKQSEAFTQTWAACKKGYLADLRGKNFGAPQILTGDVRWRLQMNVGQQSATKQKNLSVLLNLGMEHADGGDKETLQVELSEEDVVRLYESLERMQDQLDKLSTAN
jgi:preprotein translocase subunit SecB